VIARLLALDAVALGEGFRAAWRALRCALTALTAGESPPFRLALIRG
jgi:hypothetical protein